eukprot:TRINITY_DN3331_c0_g1_i1.p1 TRINITY_DN3331_c0_g1~~TRINITY_DN3331_c0_g1_i1.p1  ORF type:complete len:102 (+),score=11.40 TRINITY_DN3331_c0_g1_i1:54-359(+)
MRMDLSSGPMVDVNEIRKSAYKLVLRFLHYSPRESDMVLPFYLNCLEDPSEDVKRLALEYAIDFFPFSSDQLDFLKRLFLLKKLASEEIKKIVQNCLKFKA